MENSVTITGNLVSDPVQRATAGGIAVTKLRIAATPRYYDAATSGWKDGETLFISVDAWRGMGTNVVASLRKGDAVIVSGRLRYREYKDGEGHPRSDYTLEAQAIGPDLSRYAVDVRRPDRREQPASGETADPAAAPATVDPVTGEITDAEPPVAA